MESKYVPSFGPSVSPLMICAEAPGAVEEIEGKPLVGPAGKLTRQLCKEAGGNLDDYFKANVLRYRPPGNDLKRFNETGHTWEECIEELKKEIEIINPNCILGFGEVALNALTGQSGIGNWRGSILPCIFNNRTKVVCTIHPSALLRGASEDKQEGNKAVYPYSARYYVINDIKRAIEESSDSTLTPPYRNLLIARNSQDVFNFFGRNNRTKRFTIDTESLHGIIDCVAFAASPWDAISIPLMDICRYYNKNQQFIPWEEQIIILRFLARFLDDPQLELIGSNLKHDFKKLEDFGFRVPKNPYADTVMMMHALFPEMDKGLAFLASLLTKEPFWKHEGRDFNPFKDSWNQRWLYNAKDAAVNFEVFERLDEQIKERGLHDFYYNFLNDLTRFYIDIEREGLNVNEEKRAQLEAQTTSLIKEKQEKLDKLVGMAVNVKSILDVPEALKRLKLPKSKSGFGEDILVRMLGNNAKTHEQQEGLSLILDIRRLRTAKSNYICFNRDFDGKTRTLYNVGGTETGRSSTNKLTSPERPCKKGKFAIGWAFQTLSKHAEIGG